MKNILDENNNFLKKFLNVDSFWNLIEINENNFLKFELILSKKFKNFKQNNEYNNQNSFEYINHEI